MPILLSDIRQFQGHRVHMCFTDGLDTIATLLSATQDFDGSLHLVYDRVECAKDFREFATAKEPTIYSEGEFLLSIEMAG